MKKNSIGFRRSGLAIPLVILAVIALAGFVVTINTMSSGLRNQIIHSNHAQTSFMVAYSAFSGLLAKIHANSWANRPFANGGLYTENNVSVPGGAYDLNAIDSPGKTYQADIYVRVRVVQMVKVFVWRICYNDDLLDVSNRIFVNFYRVIDPANFPSGTGSPYASQIDAMLAARGTNQKKAEDLAAMIGNTTDPKTILSLIDGGSIAPFSPAFPITPGGSQEPVTFPVIPPPTIAEVPTTPGPGPAAPTDPNFPSPPPVDNFALDSLSSLGSEISNAAALAVTSITNFVANAHPPTVDEAYAQLAIGDAAIKTTMSGLEKLLVAAKEQVAAAPSADAARAVQDMVANTSISALDCMEQTMAIVNDMFDEGEYARGLPTSADVANLVVDWENWLDNATKRLDSIKGVAQEIGAFPLDQAKQDKISSIIAAGEAVLVFIREKIVMAKGIQAEKKAAEDAAAAEAAAAAAAAANPTPTPPPVVPPVDPPPIVP